MELASKSVDHINICQYFQGLDIHWRDHYICPTVDEYIDMVLKKTGGLMMLAFDLMYIFRNQSGM